MIAQHVAAALRRFEGSAQFLGLGVTASADRAPGQARWARVTPQDLSGGNAIVCDDSQRWVSLTVLPISAKIPLGERPEMFRVLRFLPLAGSTIYGIALAALAIAGSWTAFLVVACVGGPLIGLMYLLIARSNHAQEADRKSVV